MKCPKCGHDLREESFEGVMIDRCGHCEGLFFDAQELEQLFLAQRPPGAELMRRLLGVYARRARHGGRRVPYLIDGNNLLGSWGGPRSQGTTGRRSCTRGGSVARRAPGRRSCSRLPFRPELAAQEFGPVALRVPHRARTPTG